MADQFAGFRAEERPSDDAFALLDDMLHSLIQVRNEVSDAEVILKKAQERQRQLEEHEIPDYMIGTLGLEEFRNRDGVRVQIVKKIRASIGNRKVEAFKWLIEHGHDALIKRTVIVAFNRDQGEEAMDLVRELEDKFAGVKQDMKVEAASLTAFVKEQLEKGVDIPHDIFGIFEQKITEITI